MEQNNEFWRYSIRFYGEEGIQQICLELQDDYALDVNIVLYCHFLGSRKLGLSSGQMADLQSLIVSWRKQVVSPLRMLRQYLKTDSEATAVHAKVKLAELAAEQYQQSMMWRYFVCNSSSIKTLESEWFVILLEDVREADKSRCRELLLELMITA